MEIKLPCKSCGQNIAFSEEAAGQTVACPHCGKQTKLAVIPPSVEASTSITRLIGSIALGLFLLVTLIGFGFFGLGPGLVFIQSNEKILGGMVGGAMAGVLAIIIFLLVMLWAFLWLLFPIFVYVRLGKLIELQERSVRALERKQH